MNLAMRVEDPLIDLTDEELRERLTANLSLIRDNLAPHQISPTKEGLVPEGTVLPPAFMGKLSLLERRGREVERIRELLPAREEERKVQAEQDSAQARDHLEQVLACAPSDADRLAEAAAEALPSVERVRQFIRDLNTMALASTYATSLGQIAHASEAAAKGIGERPPKLAEMPEELPDRSEVQAVIALLSGRTGGFTSARVHRAGNYSNVPDAVRRLK